MKKEHILKKKEINFFKSLKNEFGELTEDNFDTYPIGNPFKKEMTKADRKILREIITKHRVEYKPTEKEKELNIKLLDKIKKEFVFEKLKEKKEKVRRLFFK